MTVAEQLRERVRAAFGATPRPDDDQLVLDGSSRDPEGRELAAAFAGLTWPEVTAELVCAHATALPLFKPAAFRYFLPAYLTQVLDDVPGLGMAVQSVVFSLVPPELSEVSWPGAVEFFARRTRDFSAAEAAAIAAFLELVDGSERADRAEPRRTGPMADLGRTDVGTAAAWWRARSGRPEA